MASHLKRIVAPKTWPVLRKTTKFIARPKPSGHPKDLAVPVVVLMRDFLGVVENAQQGKHLLREKQVRVNGKAVHKLSSAAGYMDLITIGKDTYRVLLNRKNQLTLIKTAAGEPMLQKIVGKTSISAAKMQLQFASGRTLLVEKDSYKVGDSVTFADNEIVAHYPLVAGATVTFTGGSHIGKVGTIETIEGRDITVSAGDEKFSTRKTHAYVIGDKKPIITVRS
jgi:small subunit ribosomal protein S4e